MHQIVPKELLEKSCKILFIGPVAIGDFCYLHNNLKALSGQYPNLKIDIWNDEYRGKSCLFRWKQKKNDIVYEWMESCSFFNKVYKNIGAWWNVFRFFKKLRQENYPIVVCLFYINPRRTAIFGRLISPSGLVISAIDPVGFDSVRESFAYIFEKNFGLKISEEQKKLSFDIDKKWIESARFKFSEWGIYLREQRSGSGRIIFLNCFAKNKKRCWDINNLIELIKKINSPDYSFIINALPDKIRLIEDIVKSNSFKNVYVFTASNSFFELPAMISLCDLVISVDTSVVHLASALNVLLVGLIRQQNTLWAPKSENSSFIYTKNKRDWINDISVDDVFKVIQESQVLM